MLKQNEKFVISVFQDSAKFAGVFENIINDNKDYDFSTFSDLWKNVVSILDNDSFREYVDVYMRQRIFDKIKSNSKISYKSIIVSAFKDMVSYHNNIIESNFLASWYLRDNIDLPKYPQTFLSYAYSDKGVTLGLYLYFLINNGFLYVNWMWSGVNSHPGITKSQLNDELDRSYQLLFLRTINSELDYYGSPHIRQWCSWEIGNYYTKNKGGKYYIDFYGNGAKKNELLATFGVFRYVKNGIING